MRPRLPGPRWLVSTATCAAVALSLASCGASGALQTVAATATTGASAVSEVCAATAAATEADVVRRIYAQAAGGRLVASATSRLGRSPALASAVAARDRTAIALAIRPLWRNQLRRLLVTDNRGNVLYARGRTPALAPFSHDIRDAAGQVVGRYTASVSGDASLTGIAAGITGGTVEVRSASGHVISSSGSAHGARVVVVNGTSFPDGAASITLVAPPATADECGADAATIHALVVAAVGRRLFATEAGGTQVRRVLAHVTATRAFQNAVAARDAAGVRAQVMRFFADPHLHVVRVRATDRSGALIADVGGPYALAPASAPVRRAGRTVGTVTLAVQDDTGYIKLLGRFTGAAVSLVSPLGHVPGSDALPGGGQQVGYTVGAFPAGPLNVTLSVPPLT